MQAGSWRVDLSYTFREQDRFVFGNRILSFEELSREAPQAAQHGGGSFLSERLEVLLRHGLTGRTALTLGFPHRRIRAFTDVADEHHRTESLEGLGDLRLGVRHFFEVDPEFRWSGRFFLNLPTGAIRPIDFRSFLDHDEAEALRIQVPQHSHLRLGTGTVDPSLGLDAFWRIAPSTNLYTSLNATVPLYKNRFGYRTGPSGTLLAGPVWNLDSEGSSAALLFVAQAADRDHLNGAPVRNTGRFQLDIAPQLTVAAGAEHSLTVKASVPLYVSIPEGTGLRDVQLVESFAITINGSFQL